MNSLTMLLIAKSLVFFKSYSTKVKGSGLYLISGLILIEFNSDSFNHLPLKFAISSNYLSFIDLKVFLSGIGRI
jgi:hypothetical protein